MKKVLLTGCTGLTGHGICSYLLKQNYTVYGTSRNALISNHPLFTPIVYDLNETAHIQHLKKIINQVDVVIHNAALISNNLPDADIFRTNVLGTLPILQNLQPGQHLIYISSLSTVEEDGSAITESKPYCARNAYLSSKIMGEIFCQQYQKEAGIRSTILRISAPYGVNGNAVFNKFIKLAMSNQDIELWGSGNREQVFTYVEDVGYAVDLAIKKNKEGVFNITGGQTISMKQLAEAMLATLSNSTSKIVFSGKPDPQEQRTKTVDISLAHQHLGYTPQTSIQQGIKHLINDNELDFYKRAALAVS